MSIVEQNTDLQWLAANKRLVDLLVIDAPYTDDCQWRPYSQCMLQCHCLVVSDCLQFV